MSDLQGTQTKATLDEATIEELRASLPNLFRVNQNIRPTRSLP
jgi:hypothetical protein